MSDDWDSYVNDSRTVCKYGTKCYQKNPEHRKTYKHPPEAPKKNTEKRRERRFSPYSKDKPSKKEIEQKKSLDTEEQHEKATEELEKEVPRSITKLKLQEPLTYYDSSDQLVLKELFLVTMPPDFFKFFECLNTDESIVKTLSSVNLELIGPFELLLGKLPKLDDKDLYLAHWRFFYDPPEFQAVIKTKGKSEYHIGYFRDNPSSDPEFVGSNDSAKDCLIKPLADNIFGAV